MTIWDKKNPTIDFEEGDTVFYLPGDTHIGRGINFDPKACKKIYTDFARDKTPNKFFLHHGDAIEGHLYQHPYRDALEDSHIGPDPINWPMEIAEQMDTWLSYVQMLDFGGEQSHLRSAQIMGNHDQSAFRKAGDLFGMKFIREKLKEENKMPWYPGFEFQPTFTWPDGATFKVWSLHGGREVPSAKVRRTWDQQLIDARAKRNLASTLLYRWDGFAQVDFASMGHTHLALTYEPRVMEFNEYRVTSKEFGQRKGSQEEFLHSEFGRPFWAANTGCTYRSHCAPWGDYHARGMSPPYHVAYVKMTMKDDYHLVVEGRKRTRKVRTPEKLEVVWL